MRLSFSILRSDGLPEKTYSAEAQTVTFGRSPDCSVVLDHDIVSGQHAYVEPFGEGFRLCDLDSTNGTMLDGVSITGSVYVTPDSVIEFGQGGPQVRVLSLDPHEQSEVPALDDLGTDIKPVAAVNAAVEPETADAKQRSVPLALVGLGLIVLFGVAFFVNDVRVGNWNPIDQGGNDSATVDSTDLRNGASDGAEKTNSVADAPAGRDDAVIVDDADPDAAFAAIKGRLVWIGIRTGEGQRQSIVPLCSGWCVSRTEIVTVADAIAPLKGSEDQAVIFSALLPEEEQFVSVSRITFPEPYRSTEATVTSRQQNNVARVISSLALPLPETASNGPLTEAEWRHAVTDRKSVTLLRCGYEITTGDERFSSVNKPALGFSRVRVAGSVPGEITAALPVMKLVGQPSKQSISGQLVIQQDGRPLGTAVQLSKSEFQMIPTDRLENFKFAEATKNEIADLQDQLSLEEQKQQLKQKLERIRDLRTWAHKRFDEPVQGETRITNFSKKVTRARGLRRKVLSHLINLPASDNTEDIWSGQGLNTLLDHLGPIALQHVQRLQNADFVGGEDREQHEPRMDYLRDLSNGLRIPRFHLNNIQCQQGLSGPPMPVKLAFGQTIEAQLLPLDWPAWFRLHNEFHEPLKKIEKARDACVAAAGTKDFTAAQQLQAAVDAIDTQFLKVRAQDFKAGRGKESEIAGRSRLVEMQEIRRCDTFLKTLRYSIARFIETDQFPGSDQYSVQLGDYDHPNGIPIVTLLAAMQERGLRFGTAARSSEVARGMIFERMRDYYVELFSLYAAVGQAEQDLQDANSLIQDAHLSNTLQHVWDWLTGEFW